MAARSGRRWFWIVVLLAGCLLAGMESRPQRLGGATPVGDVASSIGRPFQSVLTGLGDSLERAWSRIVRSGELERENARLRRQLAQSHGQYEQLVEWREEVARLRGLLELRDRAGGPTVAARAIGRGPSPWFETLALNVGRADGVAPGCAVLAPGGLLGQVYQVSARSSRVLCLTDRDGAVGVRLQPDRARHVVGVMKGTGGELCELSYAASEADVRPGDAAVTSGQEFGSLFPPGLLVGHVVTVERRPDESLLLAGVRPAVEVDRIEEVLVLLPAEPRR